MSCGYHTHAHHCNRRARDRSQQPPPPPPRQHPDTSVPSHPQCPFGYRSVRSSIVAYATAFPVTVRSPTYPVTGFHTVSYPFPPMAETRLAARPNSEIGSVRSPGPDSAPRRFHRQCRFACRACLWNANKTCHSVLPSNDNAGDENRTGPFSRQRRVVRSRSPGLCGFQLTNVLSAVTIVRPGIEMRILKICFFFFNRIYVEIVVIYFITQNIRRGTSMIGYFHTGNV